MRVRSGMTGAETGSPYKGNLYYNVDLGDGGPPFSFPQTVGHYSLHPAPAVAIETQIAP